MGVAEQLLPLLYRLVAGGRQVGRRIELVEIDYMIQPLLVGLRRGELVLHLFVGHDPAAGRIDQEDPAGMQALLEDDVFGGDVEHADFRRHHHQVVLGDVVARWPEAVAIEHGADHRAVGEGDCRGAVPRLHQRRVIFVKRPQLRGHRLVVLPRLGDHHQDGVRQRAAGHHQEFEHVVEGGGVAASFVADHRQDLLEVVAEDARLEQPLAGPHPVDVAGEGVDLAVVRHQTIGMRQRPGREGVGAEALMDQRQGRLHVGILEVGEHRRDLGRGEHALVDQGVARQVDDVERFPGVGADRQAVDGVLDPLADHIEPAFEAGPASGLVSGLVSGGVDGGPVGNPGLGIEPPPDEQVLEHRFDGDRARTDLAVVGRHVAPADQLLTLVGDNRGEQFLDGGPGRGVVGQEDQPDAVLAARRQRGGRHLAQELVGRLDQDAGAVAGVHFTSTRAAVTEVDEDLQRLLDDGVRLPPFDVDDKADAAGIVLVLGVV